MKQALIRLIKPNFSMAPLLRPQQNSSLVISLFSDSCRGDAKPGKTRPCHTRLAASGRSAERSDRFPPFALSVLRRKKEKKSGLGGVGGAAAYQQRLGKNELASKWGNFASNYIKCF